MKGTPILNMYYKFCEDGIRYGNGLCDAFDEGEYKDIFKLCSPTIDDFDVLIQERLSTAFWGDGIYGVAWSNSDVMTPLRQNIVLLMAAMNGEL